MPAHPEPPATAQALDLRPHPEGGWFRETWRTGTTLTPPGYPAERSTATGIYFLLTAGEQSQWHRVRSDELWFWHRGGPLRLIVAGDGPTPAAERVTILGTDLDRGEVPQALVPAGTWQRAIPARAEEVLVSCVVSPGFDFADFHLHTDT